jgi:hypothetical protein
MQFKRCFYFYRDLSLFSLERFSVKMQLYLESNEEYTSFVKNKKHYIVYMKPLIFLSFPPKKCIEIYWRDVISLALHNVFWLR